MSQQLFNRQYSLSLGLPKQTAAIRYGNIPLSAGGIISPLRISFDIERNTVGASQNHSKIELYNLSIESRQKIAKGWVLQLNAGYKGMTGTIFTGNVFNAFSTRKSSDVVTTLECFDGGPAISYGVLDKSYGPGTPIFQILQDISNAMNLTTDANPTGVNAGVVIGLPDYKIGYSFVAHGSCKDSLDKLLKPFNLNWSVQNSALTIMPDTTASGTAILVSKHTGMIGVPSYNNGLLKFHNLLNPQLVPNQLIKMISDNSSLNGYYKCFTCKYQGDTHDSKWGIEIDANRVSGSAESFPAATGRDFSTAVVA